MKRLLTRIKEMKEREELSKEKLEELRRKDYKTIGAELRKITSVEKYLI
jgi:hypothetical protein